MADGRECSAGSAGLGEHGFGHGVAHGCGMLEGHEGFVCVLFHEAAFDEAHGEHEEGHVVTPLRGGFQGNEVGMRFELGKVHACELVLRFGMPGKGCIAQVLCTFLGMAGLERGGSGFVFLLQIQYFFLG